MGLTDKIYKKATFELETNANGDIDTVSGDCLYRLVTGGFEMFYKEGNSETRIKLTAERVEFDRKGDHTYKMLIYPQRDTKTEMQTPYGRIELITQGEDMLYMPMQHGFDAVFRYFMKSGSGQEKVPMIVALRVKYEK